MGNANSRRWKTAKRYLNPIQVDVKNGWSALRYPQKKRFRGGKRVDFFSEADSRTLNSPIQLEEECDNSPSAMRIGLAVVDRRTRTRTRHPYVCATLVYVLGRSVTLEVYTHARTCIPRAARTHIPAASDLSISRMSSKVVRVRRPCRPPARRARPTAPPSSRTAGDVAAYIIYSSGRRPYRRRRRRRRNLKSTNQPVNQHRYDPSDGRAAVAQPCRMLEVCHHHQRAVALLSRRRARATYTSDRACPGVPL